MWPKQSSLMKKLSLEHSTHILVLFWSLPDFTFIPFNGFFCGMFVHLATQHTASRKHEIFQRSPNQSLFIRNLSLSQSWFTQDMSHSWHVVLTFYHFLSSAWIFESWQSLPKLLETLQKWPNQSSLMKRLRLEYSTHIFVFFWSLSHFTFIPFKGFLCGMFVHLATQHTASRSLEIFHASPNQCLFMRKLSLSQSWFSRDMFLWFTCGSNILPLSFICLNFWNFSKSSKIPWNFSKVFGSVIVDEKT